MNALHRVRWMASLGFMVFTAVAVAQTQPSTNAKGALVTSAGMALYTYDPDGVSGNSHCLSSCVSLWPPYSADATTKATGEFSVIDRPDHTMQWAYKGHPLYQYAGDTKPQFANGDGIDGIWHLARP